MKTSCLPESFPELCFQSQPSWLRSLPRKWASGKPKKKHVPFPNPTKTWKVSRKAPTSSVKFDMMNFVRRKKKIWTGKKKSELVVLFVNETDYPLACHDPLLQDGFSAPGHTRCLTSLSCWGFVGLKKRKLSAKCMMLHGSPQVQIEALSVYAIWMFPKIVGFPPKSSIWIGFSIINHPFWGTPIFGNIHLIAG